MPDSQRVLIKRTFLEKAFAQYDSIEIFNPIRVKTQIYAQLKPPTTYGLPVWVPDLDGVLYQEFSAEPASLDANGRWIPPSNDTAHILLLLNNGDSDKVQKIEDSQYLHWGTSKSPNWVSSSVAVKPDGSEIVYLKANNEIYLVT